MKCIPMSFRRLYTTLFLCVLLSLPLVRSSAQSAESDLTTAPPGTEASRNRGQETSHHEAGSVEASGAALRDRHFLRKAVATGFEEVELSQLALSRTSDDDLKQIARQVITDQTRLSESLQIAAEAQGVKLPTRLPPREQATSQRLKSFSDEAFEKEYLVRVAENQRRDLREYRLEAAVTGDENLRSALLGAGRLAHDHLVAAERMARSRGILLDQAARVENSSRSH